LLGTVEKIIKSSHSVSVEAADPLYWEIRIENTLTAENGDNVRLKMGVEVEVTAGAKPEDTIAG
jgi:hypothetical protein